MTDSAAPARRRRLVTNVRRTAAKLSRQPVGSRQSAEIAAGAAETRRAGAGRMLFYARAANCNERANDAHSSPTLLLNQSCDSSRHSIGAKSRQSRSIFAFALSSLGASCRLARVASERTNERVPFLWRPNKCAPAFPQVQSSATLTRRWRAKRSQNGFAQRQIATPPPTATGCWRRGNKLARAEAAR